MGRVDTNKNTLRIDLTEVFETINTDLLSNQKELANRLTYYEKKYRGDLLNDVFVGYCFDDFQPMFKVYLNNGQSQILMKYILNKQKTKIVETKYKKYNMVKNFELEVFNNGTTLSQLRDKIEDFLTANPHLRIDNELPTQASLHSIYPTEEGVINVSLNFV